MSSNYQATGSLATQLSYPWSGDDEGEVDGEGNTIRKCTPEFLNKLLVTMSGQGTQGNLDDNPIGRDSNRTRKLIRAAFTEITRLQDHPELYPDDKSGEQFIDRVKQIITDKEKEFQLTRLLTDLEDWRNLGGALKMENIFEHLDIREPATIWECFLFPGAPGAFAQVHDTSRVIPPGGTKIIAWSRRNAIAQIRAAKANGNQDSENDDGHNRVDIDTRQPFGRQRIKYRGDMIHYNPNPFYEFDHIPDTDTLEYLGEFFISLDEEQEIFDPSSMNAVCCIATPSFLEYSLLL